jgi:hypothetical protein
MSDLTTLVFPGSQHNSERGEESTINHVDFRELFGHIHTTPNSNKTWYG